MPQIGVVSPFKTLPSDSVENSIWILKLKVLRFKKHFIGEIFVRLIWKACRRRSRWDKKFSNSEFWCSSLCWTYLDLGNRRTCVPTVWPILKGWIKREGSDRRVLLAQGSLDFGLQTWLRLNFAVAVSLMIRKLRKLCGRQLSFNPQSPAPALIKVSRAEMWIRDKTREFSLGTR